MNGTDTRLYKDNSAKLTFKPHFYGENYGFINIDPTIIREMQLTDNDEFTQEVTADGGILLRRRTV
jgi:hypothetical protein